MKKKDFTRQQVRQAYDTLYDALDVLNYTNRTEDVVRERIYCVVEDLERLLVKINNLDF